MEKYCKNCKKYKNFNQYHRHRNGQFGLYPVCKECRKIKYHNKINLNVEKSKCKDCNQILDIDNFYKNKNSKNGHTSRCKNCYLDNRSKNQSKIENYMKIILDKFNKKHKTNINPLELVRLYRRQENKCFISKHEMTHIIDKKGRTDNIFNASIIPIKQKKIYQINDVKLAINLFYSVSKKYKMDFDKVHQIYKELVDLNINGVN